MGNKKRARPKPVTYSAAERKEWRRVRQLRNRYGRQMRPTRHDPFSTHFDSTYTPHHALLNASADYADLFSQLSTLTPGVDSPARARIMREIVHLLQTEGDNIVRTWKATRRLLGESERPSYIVWHN